jgi:hypothetical protein
VIEMADYSQQIDELKAANEVCKRHVITTPINGIQPEYPRWPTAFAECERVHRWWLEMETLKDDSAQDDLNTVLHESQRIPR